MIPNIENHMVVDELWEEPKPKACRHCGLIECQCEDMRE